MPAGRQMLQGRRNRRRGAVDASAGAARLIDGKRVATSVIETVKEARDRLMSSLAVKPGLAVVLVGEDPASRVYVRNKSLQAEACGFHSEQHTLPAETS